MNILITGATGFIGGATAAALIAEGLTGNLRFLIRGDTEAAGLSRLRESLLRFEVSPDQLDQFTPQQVIPGDLGDVDSFSGDARLDSATHVLNCAAVASFGNNPKIWPINVEGTVAFARRMSRAPSLKRFLHLGTAMACGPGLASPIKESWTFPRADAHLVPYTFSKAEAERQMREDIPGLPLVVARPSIVVGHSRLGCAPSTSIFWVFRMAQDLGRFMFNGDESIDVVPVDYCGSALKLLLLRENLNSDLYHVSAGVASGKSFRDIDVAMAQARGIAPVGAAYQRITEEDLPSLAPDFQARLGVRNRRLVLTAMKLYGGFSSLNYLFDNTRLMDEGLPPPPPLTDYVGRCIETTEDVPLLEQMLDDFK